MKDILKELKKINIWNPFDWYRFLRDQRVVSFILVGASGALLNLTLVAIFTELVFGREGYFYAYLIGLFSNLTYNFILFSKSTFKTKENHAKRYLVFITYSLIMSGIQAITVRYSVDFIGVEWYLLVIATIIGLFSVLNFLVYKLWLFKEKSFSS